MDIKKQRRQPDSQGNMGSERNNEWYEKAGSWQYGANVAREDVKAESMEHNRAFGTPCEDNLCDPGERASEYRRKTGNVGAQYQSSGDFDGMAPLPNPHNFYSNPGFLSESTATQSLQASPPNGDQSSFRTAGPSLGSGRSLPRSTPISIRQPSGPISIRESGGGATSGSTAVGKSNPQVGRSPYLGHGNVAYPSSPDPGDQNPGSGQLDGPTMGGY